MLSSRSQEGGGRGGASLVGKHADSVQLSLMLLMVTRYRIRYPDKTVGSLSSSGVVNAILEFPQFDEQVTEAIGEECASVVRRTTAAFEMALANGKVRAVRSPVSPLQPCEAKESPGVISRQLALPLSSEVHDFSPRLVCLGCGVRRHGWSTTAVWPVLVLVLVLAGGGGQGPVWC